MDVDQLLYHYVTDGIRENHKHHVGIELEFPLVSLQEGRLQPELVMPLFDTLQQQGFSVVKRAADGSPLAARDAEGNTWTFDTCYENMEFASTSAPSFWPIYRQFRSSLEAMQAKLLQTGHCLLGVGYNPLLHSPHLVESELTLAIASYFGKHPVQHHFPKDFYCMISSEQVHFNTSVEELPLIFEAFTRLDWLNILLFADSPAVMDDERFLCARNEFYRRSAFRPIGLVGAQSLGPKTAEEIAHAYGDICLFMRRREGKLEVFPSVRVREYFRRPDAKEEDIHQLDLERNIVTTSYGTVEYRILCSQPFGEAFGPSAFNTGLRVMLPETLALARAFDAAHDMPDPNGRNRLASLGQHPFATEDEVLAYAQRLLALAREGLQRRGFGEEALLKPLEARASLLDCPAMRLERAVAEKGMRAAFLERVALGQGIEQPSSNAKKE